MAAVALSEMTMEEQFDTCSEFVSKTMSVQTDWPKSTPAEKLEIYKWFKHIKDGDAPKASEAVELCDGEPLCEAVDVMGAEPVGERVDPADGETAGASKNTMRPVKAELSGQLPHV